MLAEDDALELLSRGQIEIEGRLVDASNTTLRAEITLDGLTRRCVYKPVRGERPLWDFPDGTLAGREVSAFLVSQATGWELVPPTILRDGPLGPGACQLWIDEPEDAETLIGFVPAYDVPAGWFAGGRGPRRGRRRVRAGPRRRPAPGPPRGPRRGDQQRRPQGRPRALRRPTGRVHGVDHGVCFHVENKLRTVLWGWTGKPIPAEAVEVLTALGGRLDGDAGRGARGAPDRRRGAARPAAGAPAAARRPLPASRRRTGRPSRGRRSEALTHARCAQPPAAAG